MPRTTRRSPSTSATTTSSGLDKVLESGHVVGLADHTVLVAGDGTERPIEDGAAPIKGGAARTADALIEVVGEALREVRPSDIRGWFRDSGYLAESSSVTFDEKPLYIKRIDVRRMVEERVISLFRDRVGPLGPAISQP